MWPLPKQIINKSRIALPWPSSLYLGPNISRFSGAWIRSSTSEPGLGPMHYLVELELGPGETWIVGETWMRSSAPLHPF